MSDDRTQIVDSGHSAMNNNAKRSNPVLLQYDGGAAGKRFFLTSKSIIIGRSPEKVQVWIDDKSVSREHCRIELDGIKAVVTDLGSVNHTFINDKMVVQSAELCHGDMLRIGNVRLKYFAHGNEDQLLFDRIYRMAVQDKMLEIFRRDYLLEKLDEEFRLTKVYNGFLSLSFLDLDKFKNINDTYGHDAGDFILKEVCKVIKTEIRPIDIFGRFGGEEFCIIMPQTDISKAYALSEKIRISIQNTKFEYDGPTGTSVLPITVSIGVAQVNTNMQTSQELIKAADTLVYQSKSNGRNRVSK